MEFFQILLNKNAWDSFYRDLEYQKVSKKGHNGYFKKKKLIILSIFIQNYYFFRIKYLILIVLQEYRIILVRGDTLNKVKWKF